MNYEDSSVFDLDKVTIGDLDLSALGRACRVIGLYFSRKDGAEENSVLQERFFDYITREGPHRIEREVALRMVFEMMLTAPDYMRMAEKILGMPLETEL